MKAYEHIDDYMNGTLDPELKSKFEYLIKEDSELQALVEQYANIKEISTGALELKLLDEVKKASATTAAEAIKQRSKSKIKPFLIGLLISLLAIGAYYTYSQSQQTGQKERLIAQILDLEPLDTKLTRSTEKIDLSDLEQGIRFYKLNKLNKSKQLLTDIIDRTNDSEVLDKARLYLAFTSIKGENWKQAKDYLSLVPNNEELKKLVDEMIALD